MQRLILDGEKCTTKETTHHILKEGLGLPDYYGANLDALWDVLTSDFSERMIVIRHPESILKNLGGYGVSLLRLFEESKQENSHIHIVYSYHF
ncbi:barstar family protein [Jeotgalibaca sp. MA1X17-3]|uniref:barstar family protein n=1 Tax=Jeotgalibaca sp. MA1X17-3 TaxID=2908211 RepID=UPI001F28C582|nr:barstar family protein [Jeotgalibaca sp. MA1X17-3]UJF15443.1 barstar family protein [Jeotgalibaca sp. MA1X17-3]